MSSGPPPQDDRAKHVWSLGSYADIAPNFLGMAAHLVESAAVGPTDSVLDVGCGTGNVAVSAARRGAQVTGLDIVPDMLDDARENASIAGVEEVNWREGTATDLPFEGDAFDITLSCVGHMFADPPDVAGRELLRVTRPGGRIAFTSWTPDGPVPAMGAILSKYLPSGSGASEPPYLWGDPDIVRDRLGDGVEDISFETGTVSTYVLSPEHYWRKATSQSGTFIARLATIDDADRPAVRAEMIETIERFFDDSRNAVPMDYRLTTATVR